MPTATNNDNEVGNRVFQIKDQKIQLINSMMPAMLTLDEMVIRQDCLCYLMERLDLSTTLST